MKNGSQNKKTIPGLSAGMVTAGWVATFLLTNECANYLLEERTGIKLHY
jgi:hypothetical protein